MADQEMGGGRCRQAIKSSSPLGHSDKVAEILEHILQILYLLNAKLHLSRTGVWWPLSLFFFPLLLEL